MALFAHPLETGRDPISALFGQRSAPAEAQLPRLARLAEAHAQGTQDADSLDFDPADPSPEAQIKRMEHKMAHGDTTGAMKIGERLLKHEQNLPEGLSETLQSHMNQGVQDLRIMGQHADANAYQQMLHLHFAPQSPEWKPAQPQGPDMGMGGGMGGGFG